MVDFVSKTKQKNTINNKNLNNKLVVVEAALIGKTMTKCVFSSSSST